MEQKIEVEKGILSPYAPKGEKKIISPEEMEAVKNLLGVKCIFIVADTEKHHCTPETCTGHNYTIDADGFSTEQLDGIIITLAEKILGTNLS